MSTDPIRVVIIISGGSDPTPREIAIEHDPARCSADEFAGNVLGDGRVSYEGAREIRRRIVQPPAMKMLRAPWPGEPDADGYPWIPPAIKVSI